VSWGRVLCWPRPHSAKAAWITPFEEEERKVSRGARASRRGGGGQETPDCSPVNQAVPRFAPGPASASGTFSHLTGGGRGGEGAFLCSYPPRPSSFILIQQPRKVASTAANFTGSTPTRGGFGAPRGLPVHVIADHQASSHPPSGRGGFAADRSRLARGRPGAPSSHPNPTTRMP
jgi:hypothetical protein